MVPGAAEIATVEPGRPLLVRATVRAAARPAAPAQGRLAAELVGRPPRARQAPRRPAPVVAPRATAVAQALPAAEQAAAEQAAAEQAVEARAAQAQVEVVRAALAVLAASIVRPVAA